MSKTPYRSQWHTRERKRWFQHKLLYAIARFRGEHSQIGSEYDEEGRKEKKSMRMADLTVERER